MDQGDGLVLAGKTHPRWIWLISLNISGESMIFEVLYDSDNVIAKIGQCSQGVPMTAFESTMNQVTYRDEICWLQTSCFRYKSFHELIIIDLYSINHPESQTFSFWPKEKLQPSKRGRSFSDWGVCLHFFGNGGKIRFKSVFSFGAAKNFFIFFWF